MRIALLGTRGVPAQYGGFETAVEEVGARLVAAGHAVTVYCRNPGQSLVEHRGMRLVNVAALRRRSLETLSHTALSMLHLVLGQVMPSRRVDVAIVFNAANAPLLPILRVARVPVAVHVDGLEWQRAKWAGLGRRYYRWAERRSARSADAVIADAQGIADHLFLEYGVQSAMIPYGAPILEARTARLSELGLSERGYHLVVARLEPENHVDLIVDGYARAEALFPLVVVGSAPYPTPYVEDLRRAFAATPHVVALGSVWDQELLDQLYSGALTYLHGHSVGGTNPSLLRAMGAASPVVAFDVVFNREVTGGHAAFFTTANDVAQLLEKAESDVAAMVQVGEQGQRRAEQVYRWDDVAAAYLALAESLTR